MTTQRQIVRLLEQYCGRDDLLIRGHDVYLVPIGHVVRGFSIYRTGEKDRFDIATFCGSSFDSTLESPRGISSIDRYENWLPRWTHPDLQHDFDRLIQQYIVPTLTCLDLKTLLPKSDARWQGPEVPFAGSFRMPHMSAPVYAALGDFVSADKQLDVLTLIPRGHRIMEPVLAALLDDLRPLIRANDRPGVADLLHKWEAAAMSRWALADHWRPTPFPLERQLPA
ncbi:hypothetical protein [Bosea lathyri]|uniref:Uncharacterized protein n=1 Tax=Bosea lathyri TaxID=1036778 RepID=A0A1H5ZE12_9HYPH|nr:hypothetical protein [Bosea lathyri]SEG34753.1 hypothetical protein SAMN04488115_104399 [Bosea lathyri]